MATLLAGTVRWHSSTRDADALKRASFRGDCYVITDLLNHGVDVNARVGEAGSTALMAATNGGHLDAVQLLLQRKAGINIQDDYGFSALYNASQNGFAPMVKILLESGAKTELREKISGNTPLNIASLYTSSEGRLKVIKLLIKYKANLHSYNRHNKTPLINAVEQGNLEAAQILREAERKP